MRRTVWILLAITLGGGALDATMPAARAGLTIFMSATGDRIDRVAPPDPRSQFAQLPFGTNPEGVVFDGLGNLFVAGGADVSKVTPSGVVSHFATLPFSAGGYGIAIDHAGNLYVADSFLSEISKIDAGGAVTTYATLPGFNPTGLAFDALGNLYVSANGTIQRVAPGGGTATAYATLPVGSNNNYGLAFDSAGNLYASDVGTLTIFKIAPGGGSISNFGILGSGGKGLAFDGNGNLYVSEVFANQIEVIKPNGDTSLFATQLDNPRYIAIGFAAVPEPSSWALLAAGLASILAYCRLHASARRANGADADLRRAPHHEIPESP
jgi:streptogramin lyase